MEHHFQPLDPLVDRVSARLVIIIKIIDHHHHHHLVVSRVQAPREPIVSSQLSLVSQEVKEGLEGRTHVVVAKDLLLSELAPLLTEDAYLEVLGLEARLLVKVGDDAACSPADHHILSLSVAGCSPDDRNYPNQYK